MNPEDHLVIRFLRYWNFNNAANLFIKSLFNSNIKISFHEALENAITELSKRNNESPPLNDTSTAGLIVFFKRQNDLFEEIGRKYQLSQLNSALVIDDEVQSTHKSSVI
ncbi:hypothetical protein [Legionella clemsonensis]|uniref:Uncharacterized protein n=1 Tax=Legionella clemsonensis TaxID=1867846 RepID=A0A222P4U1_9GAMM|nr:hypothetical protein [Legionella clemsonensis]ASQ46833.1 hypothetical protein clem_11480 [Legionella clemsonensis]